MIDSEIFEPFDKLVEIEILGRYCKVPENNSLLRCFQYLDLQNISMGDFCWNGDCANCQVWLAGARQEKPVLACRTKVRAGMEILRVSKEIKIFGGKNE
ncbi:MAG: 2Fe-2S iron-sulfur cluster-binding protein [Pyrinomonadaceae bacterium]